jgi:thiol-disulfide isomerase/thioredoxin
VPAPWLIQASPTQQEHIDASHLQENPFVQQVRFKKQTVLSILLAIPLAGCAVKVAPAPAPPKAKTAAAAATAGPEIKLYPNDKVGFDAFLVHYPGKVVLVDFWATWCPKCREDFPHTVALDRKYGPEGLVVVSFACDDADKEGEVLGFLREQEATFKNLRGVDGSNEKTFEDFQIAGGALPHYKLYDRKGKLSKSFAVDPEAEQQFSLADIDAAIQELLAEDQKPPETQAPGATVETDKSEEPDQDGEKDAETQNRADR